MVSHLQRLLSAGLLPVAHIPFVDPASVELKDGEKFQRARKRVRDALAEDGIGGDIEKLVEKLLGPV
jgi:hypothetical protein